MFSKIVITVGAMAGLLFGAGPGWAQSVSGPIFADVLRVVDGDTISVEVNTWPQQFVRTNIRLRGVDAPEIFRPKCENERIAGLIAKERLADAIGVGDTLAASRVLLTDVSPDKFGGRFSAIVQLPDGSSPWAQPLPAFRCP